MLWYEEELYLKDTPEGHHVLLIGEYDGQKVTIKLILQTPEETHEAEYWSKKIKSSLRPNHEYTAEDILHTYNSKIEKYLERADSRNYGSWITHFAGYMSDIDKAKEILNNYDLI